MPIKKFHAILILTFLCLGAPVSLPAPVAGRAPQIGLAASIGRQARMPALRRKSQQQKPAHYACPMHPEVTSTKAGKCPKCGMSLRLVADKVAPVTPPATENTSPVT